jgi:hypothetical protein
MAIKNNVINFSERLKKQKRAKPEKNPFADDSDEAPKTATSVIDLSERRKEIIATERRFVTRTVLSQFVGVFVVIPEKKSAKTGQPGLQPVSLYDVSEGGLAFDLPLELGTFDIGESVTLRIYLSHDTYFSFGAKIANGRPVEGKGVLRHGVILKKDDDSYKTLFYFVKFLENVSLVAKKDNGDRLLGRVD